METLLAGAPLLRAAEVITCLDGAEGSLLIDGWTMRGAGVLCRDILSNRRGWLAQLCEKGKCSDGLPMPCRCIQSCF